MNTEETNKNTAAPSVTIAPRNPARGVLIYVVTLADRKTVNSYPCRSLEKATALASRFIAGLSHRSTAKADVAKPARAAKPEPKDATPDLYDGPARTAEPVAA